MKKKKKGKRRNGHSRTQVPVSWVGCTERERKVGGQAGVEGVAEIFFLVGGDMLPKREQGGAWESSYLPGRRRKRKKLGWDDDVEGRMLKKKKIGDEESIRDGKSQYCAQKGRRASPMLMTMVKQARIEVQRRATGSLDARWVL